MKACLELCALAPAPGAVEAAIAANDFDGSGAMDRAEFVSFMGRTFARAPPALKPRLVAVAADGAAEAAGQERQPAARREAGEGR